jgi:hypothetical protein
VVVVVFVLRLLVGAVGEAAMMGARSVVGAVVLIVLFVFEVVVGDWMVHNHLC